MTFGSERRLPHFENSAGLSKPIFKAFRNAMVRRIEKGGRTKVDTLGILARSHGLSLKAYLDKIAEILSEVPVSHIGS